jgi:hypothetical protein
MPFDEIFHAEFTTPRLDVALQADAFTDGATSSHRIVSIFAVRFMLALPKAFVASRNLVIAARTISELRTTSG